MTMMTKYWFRQSGREKIMKTELQNYATHVQLNDMYSNPIHGKVSSCQPNDVN